MTNLDGYFCTTCGQFHSGLPMSYAAEFPDTYVSLTEPERAERAQIGSDQCIIDGEQYFIRGLIELSVIGTNEVFLWGVWARVWQKDFEEISQYWETEGRETLIGPYKGRLNNRLEDAYPEADAFNLKCTIRIQPVASRPLFFIDEPDHPLAADQRQGVSFERIQQIASRLMHKND